MFEHPIHSITCGGLDFFDGAVDFDDLAFMNLILCMQEADAALSAKMQEIRQVNALKQALTRDIQRLNGMLAKADAEDDDDEVFVVGSLEEPGEWGVGFTTEGFLAELEQIDPDFHAELEAKFGDAGFPSSLQDILGVIHGDADLHARFQLLVGEFSLPLPEGETCKKIEVQTKIEELRGKLEELNTSSSILMIDLQRLMNKRNEAVQLTSNIEAQSHQTAMSVIANFK